LLLLALVQLTASTPTAIAATNARPFVFHLITTPPGIDWLRGR
jgi:hypothetical protein